MFKLDAKVMSMVVKYIAKHPPPMSHDLQFTPLMIDHVLKQSQGSHCYDEGQLAWLDSMDQCVGPRVSVPAHLSVLNSVNAIGGQLRDGKHEEAEAAAMALQAQQPELTHPFISELCFRAAIKTKHGGKIKRAALRQLHANPRDRRAASAVVQLSEGEDLRVQAARLLLGK